jgi:hypothetical protein
MVKRKCMKEINLCRDISWQFGAGIHKTPRVGHGESIKVNCSTMFYHPSAGNILIFIFNNFAHQRDR